MGSLLDEVFDDLKTSFDKKVSDHFYHIKFTEIRNFFYVLIKKERKNFRWKDLIMAVEYIALKVYNK